MRHVERRKEGEGATPEWLFVSQEQSGRTFKRKTFFRLVADEAVLARIALAGSGGKMRGGPLRRDQEGAIAVLNSADELPSVLAAHLSVGFSSAGVGRVCCPAVFRWSLRDRCVPFLNLNDTISSLPL